MFLKWNFPKESKLKWKLNFLFYFEVKVTVHRDKFLTIKSIYKYTIISQIIFGLKLYMFLTVPLSIVRSFALYAQQWYMSYRYTDSLRAGSEWSWVPSWLCTKVVHKPVWHISLLCVQRKSLDDGQRDCPKHVGFHSKSRFKKLLHLVGFIVRNFHFVFEDV
jgi:hypothetical protein